MIKPVYVSDPDKLDEFVRQALVDLFKYDEFSCREWHPSLTNHLTTPIPRGQGIGVCGPDIDKSFTRLKKAGFVITTRGKGNGTFYRVRKPNQEPKPPVQGFGGIYRLEDVKEWVNHKLACVLARPEMFGPVIAVEVVFLTLLELREALENRGTVEPLGSGHLDKGSLVFRWATFVNRNRVGDPIKDATGYPVASTDHRGLVTLMHRFLGEQDHG
jgi:hypothetical protein